MARGLAVIQDDTIVFSHPGLYDRRSRSLIRALTESTRQLLVFVIADVSHVNWRETHSEGDQLVEWRIKWTGREIKSWRIGWVMVSLGTDSKRNPTVHVYEIILTFKSALW